MEFISTRGKDKTINGAEAIVKGLASDGGLFVPSSFPNLYKDIEKLLDMEYYERATEVISSFLPEYDKSELLDASKKAYSKFEDNQPAPVVKINDGQFILELFHGPTLAFKDIALTLLPYLLRKGADICGIKEQILILVATSGDTGKAALEGFKDADGIKINVFYPDEGVSDMQKLQMSTQEGSNVNVVAVRGNFDDCQTAVKNIFSDKDFNAKLLKNGTVLSSANSINFGRLVPQIAYYFSAYCDLVNSDEIKLGDKVNFTVPTGNFGNILAGYYAKQMGLPIGKLICASNENNVLTEFMSSGVYNKEREFFKTMSPSMDILISSNLERLIFELSDRNFEITAQRMSDLKLKGSYSVSKKETEQLNKEFFADYAGEDDCLATISEYFEETGYLFDTHTSVAVFCSDAYIAMTNDNTPNVILSTASAYKFPQSVLLAVSGKSGKDAFVCAEKLNALSAYPIPEQITSLKTKQKRFNLVIDKKETEKTVENFVK